MKKTKRQENRSEPQAPAIAKPWRWWTEWWIWTAALAGLLVVFEVYSPALSGGFVLDDLSLPFLDPNIKGTLGTFVGYLRPLLGFSFWVDYHRGNGTAADPYTFHTTNVFLHFIASIFATLIVLRLLEWADVERRKRAALAIFAGGVFLLHPLQTESVAYVASRSEVLSVMFYYAALAVFVWKPGDKMTLPRALAIVVLFGVAAATKEHTLTLPALLLITDYFWGRGGIRKNAILYGLLAIGAVIGGAYVATVLRNANTAGFGIQGLTPVKFLMTEGRVVWTYVRMFALPFGQNIDPDVPVSQGFDLPGILGWLAIIAITAAAWVYRKRTPLASFGVIMFVLLIAPTSSIIPIKDVLAEHRMYLPFLGLILICCEALRRVAFSQVIMIATAALLACCVLTYQRCEIWSSPLSLWNDAASKSPNKLRPRFQIAHGLYSEGRFPEAVQSYETAAKIGPVDDTLLVDWALALTDAHRPDEALQKFRQAVLINNTAHVHTQIAVVFARQQRYEDARAELEIAKQIDPGYDVTYGYLGAVEEAEKHIDAARAQYRHALELNPQNQMARAGMARMGQ
jgi:Flp pilus assembly protein TadD